MTSRSQRGSRATVAGQTLRERVAELGDGRVARALVAHPDRTAAGLLALFVFLYLAPALLGQGVLAPTALLSIGPPWKDLHLAGLRPYVNLELGEVPLSYYPWEILARRLIHAGTFPAWNPHALAGTPFWANFEVGWLSPFSLPLWVLPLDYGLGVSAALKLWTAGFGTYLLARELRLGFWPALVAALSFTLCAFNVARLTFAAFSAVAVLFPWALWLTERLVRRARAVDGLWLALAVAAIVFGGHPGTQVHVLGGTALYALLRCALVPAPERAALARSLPLVGGGVAVGVLLASVALLPAQLAAQDTLGAALRSGKLGGFEKRVPFDAVRTVLFPEWWGRRGGGSLFKERTFYVGVIPLVLAALALVSPGAWRRKAPFVVLVAVGGAVAMRAPLLHGAVRQLPGFGQVQNQRMLLWLVLGLSLLSAFGLRRLLDAPRERRPRAVLAAAIVVALVAAALAGVEGEALSGAAAQLLHRAERAAPAALALASVAWALLLLLAFAAVVALLRRSPQRTWIACALIALLVAFDLQHFAHGYNPIGPASVVTPPRTPAIAYLQRHAGEQRIAGVAYALPTDWSSTYGLRDVRGYDPPQPTLRFHRLWTAAGNRGEPGVISALTPEIVKLIGMLGGRYVIADPTAPDLEQIGLRVVYRARDATIFANELVVPRAFVPSLVDAVSDEAAEVSAVAEAGFDPRSHATVRRDELGEAAVPTGGSGTARVVAETNDSVTIRARLAARGLVVLDDQWMDGWSVSVDGRPAPVLQADVVLRGVIVPAGSHTVVWSYRVPGLRAGVGLSGLGAAVLLAWAGALVVRSRTRRAARQA